MEALRGFGVGWIGSFLFVTVSLGVGDVLMPFALGVALLGAIPLFIAHRHRKEAATAPQHEQPDDERRQLRSLLKFFAGMAGAAFLAGLLVIGAIMLMFSGGH